MTNSPSPLVLDLRPEVAVVILNYRTPELVADCLGSLADEIHSVRGHAVVVDNASGDGSAEWLQDLIVRRRWSGWATLIHASSNAGFAAGNNVGIRSIHAPIYILLNSDTLVRPGALLDMIRVLAADQTIGLLGPRLEHRDGTPQVSCFRDRTPVSEMIQAAASRWVTRLLPGADVPIPVTDDTAEPQWLSFAAVAIRREVIDDIGLLDEGYFMYFEDIDYCRRARLAGWRLFHHPDPRVIHLQGGSSRVVAARRARERVPCYYYESRSRYFAKHFGGRPGLWLANGLWLVGRLVSFTHEIATRRSPHTSRRAWLDNWTNAMRPLRPAHDPAEPRPAFRP